MTASICRRCGGSHHIGIEVIFGSRHRYGQSLHRIVELVCDIPSQRYRLWFVDLNRRKG